MNSRQRIKLAIEHKETDRVPIDFGAMRSTGIAAIAYNKLLKRLGIKKGPVKMYDFMQQLAYPQKEIRDIFHIDAIDAGQAFLENEGDWKQWILDDNSECLIPGFLNILFEKDGTVLVKNADGLTLGKKPKSSLYVKQIYWSLKECSSIPEKLSDEDLSNSIWSIPSPPWHLDIYDKNQFQEFIKGIKNLYNDTDYAIMLAVGCNLFETGTFIRGMENFLYDIYLDRKGTERLLDRLTEKYLRLLERVLSGVGEYVTILQFGDDLGTQQGTFMSPDIFQKIFIPKYKKMWDFVHSNSNCKIFLHSCGSLYEFLPYLIDAGLDVINPVQTTAYKMEPERLKKEFGKDITFWGGGCNTRDILPSKKPNEVRDDVKRRIEIFSKGGGFVFNQIHNILADIPAENIIALFEAAYEYGFYDKSFESG